MSEATECEGGRDGDEVGSETEAKAITRDRIRNIKGGREKRENRQRALERDRYSKGGWMDGWREGGRDRNGNRKV